MRGRFTFTVLVLAVIAAGVLVALRARRGRASAEQALVVQQRRHAELAARLESADALRRAMPAPPIAMPEAAPAPAPAASPPPDKPALDYQKLMETDPEFQVRFLAVQRALVALDYGAFFRSRQLSPAEVERFSELLVEKEAKREDLASIQQTRDLKFSDPALAAQREQARTELQAAQRALLGEAGFTALQEYERVRALWRFVGNKAGLAVFDGIPLTADQADRLGQVLIGAATIPRGQSTAQLKDVDWPTAQLRAKAILSDEQITVVFGRDHARSDAQSRLEAEFNRVTNELFRARLQAAKAP